MIEALLVSTGVVAVAEIGDKTQLLSLVLAARFRKPLPIVLGILFATVANHAAAAWVGEWVRQLLGDRALRWLVGVSFLAIAGWALVPDRLEQERAPPGRYGVFLVTLVSFFIVEIGDKTQIATVALAAKYHALWSVVSGTTLGMLLANVPAVLLGEAAATRLPLQAIRVTAALLFAALGVMALAGFGQGR